MLIKPDTQLNLDPGSPPRRRPISGCKCLLITAFIIFLSTIIFFLASVAKDVVTNLSNPHRALYQNASLDEVPNRALVVQPLIDRDQTFDIAATVWLRSGESIGHEAAEARETRQGTIETPAEVLESPLYSDIIFRGLHLTDKNVFSIVNFTLPTDIL
jgi:hypothetical protein